MKAENAVIMAAGFSSRFAPLSYERPKALVEVRGDVLVERQICQLQEAGIRDICLVTGYKSEAFSYLEGKFGVTLLHNSAYEVRNNHSSIYTARDYLGNTFVCSADNYFAENPFLEEAEDSYYAAVYAEEETGEWCLETDENDYICKVTIGGKGSWHMLGHTFWSAAFSRKFLEILEREYDLPKTKDKLWESMYMEHLDQLKMKICRYPSGLIFEFDSLDELRLFDPSYKVDSRSKILQKLSGSLGRPEGAFYDFQPIKKSGSQILGFSFVLDGCRYAYDYKEGRERLL